MTNGHTQPATGDPKPKAVKTSPGEAKEKKATAPKKPKDPNAVQRPRLPKPADEMIVTVLKPNSKSRGAAERFQRYATGMTIRQYVDAVKKDFDRTEGMIFADIRWDQDHKFIHVDTSARPDLIPQPAPPPAQAAPQA
jgi:hypothetical protein